MRSFEIAPPWMMPAAIADVADRLWEISDIMKLLEAREAKPAKHDPFRSVPWDECKRRLGIAFRSQA